MSRTSVVVAVDAARGMVAIQTDDGNTIIELTSDFEIEIGDTMSWTNDYGLSMEPYDNRTKRISDEVFVQNHSVSEQEVGCQFRKPGSSRFDNVR